MATLPPHQMPQPLSLEDADIIASRNRLQSPLLRLPGEIRNRIYAFAFTVKRVEKREIGWSKSKPLSYASYRVTVKDWKDADRSIGYSLCQVITSTMACRQFYTEASPLIPRLNEFCFIGSRFGQEFTDDMPHQYLQTIETINLENCMLETLEQMQKFVDITLSRLNGLRKIAVKTRAVHCRPRPSLHELEVWEKMFVGVLRKRGFGCEVLFEHV